MRPLTVKTVPPPLKSKVDFEKLRLILGDAVDEGQERYAFTWPGKAGAIRQAQTPTTVTLRPDEKSSVNWDNTENLYIEGDNLEVLKLLQRGYHGKVKMIYIDPPYNTGHDFVYKDTFQDSIGNYKKQAGLSGQSNADTSGRYHSDWLSMMYPRLRLARELLSDDGVIFISIDDNEDRNLRILCDEVFGEANFIAQLVWERAYSPKNDAKFISNSHDYVIMYAKDAERFTMGRLPRTVEADARYKNPDNDPRGPWMSSDLSVKTYTAACDYPITTPSGRVVRPLAGRCWRLSEKALSERLADGRIWFGSGGDNTPRIKRFLSELKYGGLAPTSILFYKDVGHSQDGARQVQELFDGKNLFDGPKPLGLLDRMLRLANLEDCSIVLDFFSGSATTAQAVMDFNKNEGLHLSFILAQLDEVTEEEKPACREGYANLCQIGEERIRRAGQKIKAEVEEENRQLKPGEEPKPILDIGFRVLKLDSSNFDEVPEGALIDNIVKPDRTNDDIIFEMMLKWGLDLSLPMEKTEVRGAFRSHSRGRRQVLREHQGALWRALRPCAGGRVRLRFEEHGPSG